MNNFTIACIPALKDNYIWIGHDKTTAFVVDPGDSDPVQQYLAEHGLDLTHIIITHHHFDHTGGALALVRSTGAKVYASSKSSFEGNFYPVDEGDEIDLPGGGAKVIAIPGHTLDHIAVLTNNDQRYLFVGDTLFMGGCGRIFEGTTAQMYSSLNKLASLPGDALVFCAHEYTISNLKFGEMIEPDNQLLSQRLNIAQGLRQMGAPTVPSALSLELETNPFLRCHIPSVILAASSYAGRRTSPGEDTFGVLRAWKNQL